MSKWDKLINKLYSTNSELRFDEISKIPDMEEGGFTAYFPELKGCVTCGETYTEAVENAMDAKKEWITTCIEEGLNIPEPDERAFSWY